MGMEGHKPVLGVQDEIQVFGQQELPLGKLALAEHKTLNPDHTIHQMTPDDGWVCTGMTEGKRCMSAWPPPTPAQARMEEMADSLIQTGRYEREGVVVEYLMDVPILGDPNRINKIA